MMVFIKPVLSLFHLLGGAQELKLTVGDDHGIPRLVVSEIKSDLI